MFFWGKLFFLSQLKSLFQPEGAKVKPMSGAVIRHSLPAAAGLPVGQGHAVDPVGENVHFKGDPLPIQSGSKGQRILQRNRTVISGMKEKRRRRFIVYLFVKRRDRKGEQPAEIFQDTGITKDKSIGALPAHDAQSSRQMSAGGKAAGGNMIG